MIPIYSIIMWAQSKSLDMDKSTDICFRILNLLKQYGEELSPNYLTASKKKSKTFELSKENVKTILIKNLNKENGEIFDDLGSHISFFSSKQEEKSCRISISIGSSVIYGRDTIIIRLPYLNFSGFSYRKDDFENLFYNIVDAFNPFYAFISNSLNKQLSDLYWQNDMPTYVHWFNYYDNSVICKIGIDRIYKMDNIKKTENGCFLKIQNEPINVNDELHLFNQYQISRLLGFLKDK